MLIIALLIATFNTIVSSAPVLPSTTDFDVATSLIFGRELPDCANTIIHYRTIQDIIWSCLTTIFACTWVAVHPNVPRPTDSGWKKFWERVLVMVFAFLVPEFVIAWALRQWRAAVRHTAKYNQKHHGVTPPSNYLRWYIKCWFHQDNNPSLWTITHGFLLEMDGLVDDSGKPVRSVDKVRDPLDISEEEISDKSKGDTLTRTLVVLQTTWFILQCLARWMKHLPVTELEVLTLAFALLNIGTYVLWWNKPQRMSLALRMGRYRRPNKDQQEQVETAGGEMGKALQRTPSEAGSGQNIDEVEPLFGDRPHRSGPLGRAAEAVRLFICRFGALIGILTVAFHPHRIQSLTFGGITDIVTGPLRPPSTMMTAEDGERGIFYSSRDDDITAGLSMVIISPVFGALHLIPLWSSPFPSSSEQFLWKLSAIFITIYPFLFLCLCSLVVKVQIVALRIIYLLLAVGSFASYAVIRIILVTLAFTTLRKLPPDVFREVAWTTFLPHF